MHTIYIKCNFCPKKYEFLAQMLQEKIFLLQNVTLTFLNKCRFSYKMYMFLKQGNFKHENGNFIFLTLQQRRYFYDR
jgi:hypothetical protein